MDKDQMLGAHEGHSLEIRHDEETNLWSLECNTCGEYILEQDAEGIVIFG